MAVVGQTAYMPTLTIYAEFVSLLPPTDIRCFPTDLKTNVKIFLSWIVHILIILVDFYHV